MEADRALEVIRECVGAGRFTVSRHFTKRMDKRGLFWPDVLAVLGDPKRVTADGLDSYDRPKWIVGGSTSDGFPIEVVCVLDEDSRGRVTVFVTIYWKD